MVWNPRTLRVIIWYMGYIYGYWACLFWPLPYKLLHHHFSVWDIQILESVPWFWNAAIRLCTSIATAAMDGPESWHVLCCASSLKWPQRKRSLSLTTCIRTAWSTWVGKVPCHVIVYPEDWSVPTGLGGLKFWSIPRYLCPIWCRVDRSERRNGGVPTIYAQSLTTGFN